MGGYPMAHKHTGGCSCSFSTRQVQTKTTMKHYHTPEWLTLPNVDEDVGQSGFQTQLVGLAPPTLKKKSVVSIYSGSIGTRCKTQQIRFSVNSPRKRELMNTKWHIQKCSSSFGPNSFTLETTQLPVVEELNGGIDVQWNSAPQPKRSDCCHVWREWI